MIVETMSDAEILKEISTDAQKEIKKLIFQCVKQKSHKPFTKDYTFLSENRNRIFFHFVQKTKEIGFDSFRWYVCFVFYFNGKPRALISTDAVEMFVSTHAICRFRDRHLNKNASAEEIVRKIANDLTINNIRLSQESNSICTKNGIYRLNKKDNERWFTIATFIGYNTLTNNQFIEYQNSIKYNILKHENA